MTEQSDCKGMATMTKRLETGPTKLAGDWPGIFIRGDQSLGFAGALRRLLAGAEKRAGQSEIPEDELSAWGKVQDLAELLESCRVRGETPKV
jgi:hypothetical protein